MRHLWWLVPCATALVAVRVWWAGPLKGVNGRRTFRVAVLVLSLVTVTSATMSRPRRRRH